MVTTLKQISYCISVRSGQKTWIIFLKSNWQRETALNADQDQDRRHKNGNSDLRDPCPNTIPPGHDINAILG